MGGRARVLGVETSEPAGTSEPCATRRGPTGGGRPERHSARLVSEEGSAVVDFVLVGSGEDGLRSSVAAATGLVEVGPTETGTLWQVDKPYSGRFLIAEPDGTTTKINEPGPPLDEHTVDRIVERIVSRGAGAQWLVFAGSVPPGPAPDVYAALAARVSGAQKAPTPNKGAAKKVPGKKAKKK